MAVIFGTTRHAPPHDGRHAYDIDLMKTTPENRIRDYRAGGWWSDQRITDLFDTAVREQPTREALVDPANRVALTDGVPLRLTFAEVAELVEGYAATLAAAGLGKDDIIITQLPNIAEYVALYFAAMRLGIIVSPVPMQFRQREIGQMAALTDAKAVFTIERFKGQPHLPELRELCAARGMTLWALTEEGEQNARPNDMRAFSPAPRGSASRAELPGRIAAASVSADDIATICWTSGTEGTPKGVPRSHNHWLAISHAHFLGAKIALGERLLNPFPLVNMAALGGCLMSWLHARGTLVLHHPLDLPVYLRQIAEERIGYAIAPPAVLNMLIKDERLLASLNLETVRCVGSGSAPLDPSMIRSFKDLFGIEVVNIFGSNEGVSLLSNEDNTTDAEQRAVLFPRWGRAEIPWPDLPPTGIRTRLIDPTSGAEVLQRGTPGEMQIIGPTVFDGYWRAPQVDAESFTVDGWFRTGDLFELQGDGATPRYYKFVGRHKQVINRGGVKIAPEELDIVLAQMPDIVEGAVVGYPDAVLGERICAVLVPKPGKTLSLDDLKIFFTTAGVAIFKHPERLRVVDQLPRNSVGKVVRSELARLAASDSS